MLAGGTHIDHVEMLRAGRTGRVLGFAPMAPSTVGTFLRTFTFGHIRQLEAVLSRTLARAWGLGAGPGKAPLVVDLDSTICEVHGKQKQGAAYGYTNALGYHPLLATRADTGEVLGARMRKGSAGSSRGVVRFVDELVANLRRAGAAGPTTVRADSGFWSRKLIDRLDAHDVKWSITVALGSAVRAAIQAIGDTAWTDIDYTNSGHAQVAETEYTTGRGKAKRTVRLVVLCCVPDFAAEGPSRIEPSLVVFSLTREGASDDHQRGSASTEEAVRGDEVGDLLAGHGRRDHPRPTRPGSGG